MHIEDAVRNRHAIKGYDPSFNLAHEEEGYLLDLALHAPSAFNLQRVRLVEVSDPQLHTQLHEVIWDQAQVTNAAMLVVVCAQPDSWERNTQRVQDGVPEVIQAFTAGAIDAYYRDKPQIQRDEAMRSCGLLTQILMLVTRGQSLDSYSIDGFDFGAVARLIGLPNNYAIDLMVTVGKRAVEPQPHSGRLPREELIIRDCF